MANPVDQQPDGPSPPGDAPGVRGPADASTPAPRLPTRVPFAGPHPGTVDRGRPRSESPPPLRRTTLTNRYPRSVPRAGQVPTEPSPAAAPPDTPERTPRSRTARVRILAGAAAAALLVAGSLWWSHASPSGETSSVAPAEAGTPITARATEGAPAGFWTASDGSATGSPASAASPAPPQRPTHEAAPPARKASANTSGRNLALNGVATASSVERASWAASNAVDGNPATRWSSGFSDPQWLRVDLGARWQISEVRLAWENAHATAYRLEISTDGRTWKTVYRTSDGQGGNVIVKFAQLPARFVRMYGTRRSTTYGYSLLELEVR